MSGFAELYAARERSERPAPATPPLVEGELPKWVERLSADARRTLLSNLRDSRNRSPLAVPQEEIDRMTDDEKWAYAEAVVREEHKRARATEEAAALAAQTSIEEGHQ